MLRYQSRRHRYLMDESEQALSDAAGGSKKRDARIANQILDDDKIHRLWESRHADLVLPVSEQARRAAQIYRLRDIEVKLIHRRALIDCIRRNRIQGEQRDHLFAAFYGPRDSRDAVLLEHRQYTLAVSSRVSADHLINVMDDPVSVRLIRAYERTYTRYFDLYCVSVNCKDRATADATRQEMSGLRQNAMHMIKRIHSEKPEGGHSSFERQALLARSGRYPILDYMVG